MGKELFIAEKPSVAKEFAKALGVSGNAGNGYMETAGYIVTWCVGHLVTMSYPEVYDASLKKWSMNTLPFIPDQFLYELIPGTTKQFNIVKKLLNRDDVQTIYVCTDSGREGEYIYRLVDQMAKVPATKDKRRVWIDSQTEEEIKRGIKEAKPLSAYDNLAASAYLRAKEDYLMGINFSRVLSLRYGGNVMSYLNTGKWHAIAVGRVMTCVLGLVVRREREIRAFVKTPFYRILGGFNCNGQQFEGEWRAVKGSAYFESPLLYKENGYQKKEDASACMEKIWDDSFVTQKLETSTEEPQLQQQSDIQHVDMPDQKSFDEKGILEKIASNGSVHNAIVQKIERKKEKKNPPLLFNLAEIQNVCSKLFKISPADTLKIIQELYEKKLVTYPRTDARVLSTAVSKEIDKNIAGLRNYSIVRPIAEKILTEKSYQGIAKTRYVNDKQITDHYAIIPTGQGFAALRSINPLSAKVYEVIVRRFLSIFYPPAEYAKISLVAAVQQESFFANFKVLVKPGYLEIATASFAKKKMDGSNGKNADGQDSGEDNVSFDQNVIRAVANLKQGMSISLQTLNIKEGETSPPKRYNSGSMILAMENAGQLIEDEDLRAQIKSNGIGTSATRAEILSKLVRNGYLKLNKKTQVIMPELLGEMIYDVVESSIPSLLNPELTASWETGLNWMAEGKITEEEYMNKLDSFIARRVNCVKRLSNQGMLRAKFDQASQYYKTKNK